MKKFKGYINYFKKVDFFKYMVLKTHVIENATASRVKELHEHFKTGENFIYQGFKIQRDHENETAY